MMPCLKFPLNGQYQEKHCSRVSQKSTSGDSKTQISHYLLPDRRIDDFVLEFLEYASKN